MRGRASRVVRLGCLLAGLLIAPTVIHGREEPVEPQFKYAAGTESVQQGCEGNLELSSTGLTFRCPGGSITVPFSDITLMEYRNDVSRKIRKMKIQWRAKPNFIVPLFGGKRNRYFTVVFKANGANRAMVLRVTPVAMRPYLAEIDLKSAHRVEVRRYGD